MTAETRQKRTTLKTSAWWYRTDPRTQSFEETVRAACAFHARRGLGVATHCSVDPGEPGVVDQVDEVVILTNSSAGLGNFCAHREEP